MTFRETDTSFTEPQETTGSRAAVSAPPADRAWASAIAMALPDISQQDIDAVSAVVRSERLALGPMIPAFERAIARYAGVEHAVAVNSGTSALHLIVKALGLGSRDEVLVPSFTFAASVNAILYEGAKPVFVEIDPDTLNLDVSDLEHRITHRTRAILAVDVFGLPADWAGLARIAKRYGLALIDDCCEGLGAEFSGRRLGSFGQAGAFAFYPNKQITTGEGGMIVTNDTDLAILARSYANQGRGAMGAWLNHDRIGYNYRMDEMSAALGLSQMGRIEAIMAKRDRVAAMYNERLAFVPRVEPPGTFPNLRRSWFVYVVTLEEGLQRDLTILGMEREGVPARGYFSPIHTQPYIRQKFGNLAGSLPVTEAMAKRTLALPFHNNLTEAEIDHVVAVLQRNLR
ncbi:MAG: DegT/DnrJ/EryC1/StrS family aminotransferase [Holophaga sp.]|nr:DegT/DnrJ/EryC1/StrS family aminotransferase [Holophaga sp.]